MRQDYLLTDSSLQEEWLHEDFKDSTMKKGILVFALVLVSLTNLMAASHYGFTVNGFEPSAINMALGGSPVGVVNIWHNDPLNAYDNPAFPALQKGLSLSNNRYAYMKVANFDDLHYSAALSSISSHGFGLLVPYINHKTHKTCSYIDYGAFSITDEEVFDGVPFQAYDQMTSYGLSVNLPQVYRLIKPEAQLLPKNADLALGINLIHNSSYIWPEPYLERVKAKSADLGLLARIDHIQNSKLRLESAYGLSYFNAFSNKVIYFAEEQADRIYQRLNLGVSLSCSLKNGAYPAGEGIESIVENLGTARLLAGAIEEFASDPLLLGLGGELGILDTIFMRVGYHDDNAGKISGLTYGLGINLHYRDLISAVYNYSYFPKGSLSEGKSAASYSFSIDLLNIIREINRSH